MSITKLENAIYTAEDWQDEIVSKDLLKIGHLKIGWEISGDDILVKTDSAIDIAGNIYLIDADETITGPITDRFITFNGTTFSTSDVDLLFDNDKNGYYIDGTTTRVVGYFNGTAMQSINKDIGYIDVINTKTISAETITTSSTITSSGTITAPGGVVGDITGYITGGCKYSSSGTIYCESNTADINITLGSDGDGFYLINMNYEGENVQNTIYDIAEGTQAAPLATPEFILVPAGQPLLFHNTTGSNVYYSYRKFG